MPEFRVYYDDAGKIVTYTGDLTTPGNYLVIDHITYLLARHDVLVKNGKLVPAPKTTIIKKLVHSINGIKCAKEDVTIITNDDTGILWELKTSEIYQ